VSAPVTWEEAAATAEGRLDLELTPDDILRRVNRLGDLFAPVLAVAQDLGVSRSRTAGKPEPMDEREQPGEDPTIEADRATPTEPGPGDSEGAKPESPPEEDGERKDE
jgi:hypothetical protein